MSDIIHLLPDSIANQIAAGEVIQRPASVVKELTENAVDAGADNIRINIKDAGRTLIQVIDNGKGMSETDARMAFERHATSKISNANDLFSLRTMGFRGEALASIAAVAQVELKTSRTNDETGTMILISASQVEKQETIVTQAGSIFSVKNLFFNVPARRKFLKSNETEFRNILTEFERIALVYPSIVFSLWHNDNEIYNLPVSSLKQRIVNIFGKKLAPQMQSLNVKTSLVELSGFIGNPDSSKKHGAMQYFFVNGRYMRHPYFHRAVMAAFEPYIPAGDMPNYFIYLTVDPSCIDVNIHPTKTEIKFENEQAIWQILSAAVKEAIAVPDLEFDRSGAIDMPVYDKNRAPVEAPHVTLRPGYNPFKQTASSSYRSADWEKLYEASGRYPYSQKTDVQQPADNAVAPVLTEDTVGQIMQYKGKAVCNMPQGLTLIHLRRAHIRINFDDYMQRIQQKKGLSQGVLFPEIVTFTASEAAILPFLLDELSFIGFDLADLGNNSFSINGIPAGLIGIDTIKTLQDMVAKAMETGCEIKEEISEALALTLAKKAAIPSDKTLSDEEMHDLVNKLFLSSSSHYTPDGKLIVSVIGDEEMERRFKGAK